ncbi:putative receptor protein kinase ZmPK1 [Acorus calamus]|uniref:non-specific serine/threonine protein kinase n=1 Tax=Acorus calamus TaxID=4465 RepID=A0AAV9C509_ACOCL|nr:putative receptor protein kinase ZmPK1 [Acorus calamus]
MTSLRGRTSSSLTPTTYSNSSTKAPTSPASTGPTHGSSLSKPEDHLQQQPKRSPRSVRHLLFERSIPIQRLGLWVDRKRRLTLDFDGNLRLYTLGSGGAWGVTWQAIAQSCRVHGACGANSLCVQSQQGRTCACPRGFVVSDPCDLSRGCEPTFKNSCPTTRNNTRFLPLPRVDFYGYDLNYTKNKSLGWCKGWCLRSCDCKGILYRQGLCYTKALLLTGRRSSSPGAGLFHYRWCFFYRLQ